MQDSSPEVSSSNPRRHDLDALRAFAMLLGILLHGALAFMPFPWVVQDTQKTPVAGLIVAVIHGFRMPLFFLMSGFFTAMLRQKRGVASMLVLGHVEVARELLDHGATIDARDQGGRTAMHAAAFMGKADVAELLLARGAEPLPQGPVGDTPIDSSTVDGTTTTMLAGVLGLPAPDMDEVEAGRRRVRQLLLAAMLRLPYARQDSNLQAAARRRDPFGPRSAAGTP